MGPVGVGKSTVIAYLSNFLMEKNIKNTITFLKIFHGLSFLLWNTVKKLLKLNTQKRYAPWYVIIKAGYVKTARALTIISAYLDAFINIPFKILLKVVLFKRLGYWVLSEEFPFLGLGDYLSLKKRLNIKKWIDLPIKILFIISFKYEPDYIIYLDVDYKTLTSLWKCRGYGEPQFSYLIIQEKMFKLYYSISNAKKMKVLNRDVYETVLSVYDFIR
jgi:hypothetical protein